MIETMCQLSIEVKTDAHLPGKLEGLSNNGGLCVDDKFLCAIFFCC